MDNTEKTENNEIIEKNGGPEDLILLGIKRRGVPLAKSLAANIERFEGKEVPVGTIDITLYRDDLTETVELPTASDTEIPCDITDRNVILVDDIFTTGSTIEACTRVLLAAGVPTVFGVTLCVGMGEE